MISHAAVPITRTGAGLSAAAAPLCAGVITSIIARISTGVPTRAAACTGTSEGAPVHAVNDGRLLGERALNVGIKPIVVSKEFG